MIRPAISPRRITTSASVGLVSAARSGVRNIQSSVNTISNAPGVTREQKFGMNYVGFFGSKKNSKTLSKSLKTIRDSVVSTFGIASALKLAVRTGTGIFGFIGKTIGFASTLLSFLPFGGLIKQIIGVIAIGGLGKLLLTFKDQVLKFFENNEVANKIFKIIKTNATEFTNTIKRIVAEFLVSRTMSAEFQSLQKSSESRLNERIKKAEASGVGTQDATIQETNAEIDLLKKESSKFFFNENPGVFASQEEKDYFKNQLQAFKDRITELKTGRVPAEKDFQSLGILSGRPFGKGPITLPFTSFFDFFGKFAGNVTAQKGIYSTKDVGDLSAAERLDLVKSTLGEFGEREDISKAKLIYQRELDKRNLLNFNQKGQAEDIIRYLDAVEDPFAKNENIDKQFLKELENISPIMPKKKEDTKLFGINVDRGGVAGVINRVTQGANNVRVLSMGGNKPSSNIISSDIGSGNASPSMQIFSNVDHDNFVALINKSSLNVV